MAKAVFLDRDGVIVEPVTRDGKPYAPRTLDEFHWVEEAREPLRALSRKGFLVMVVTNQPDIARKKMDAEILNQMHDRLSRWLGGSRILQAVYVCPHDDSDQCECRKPKAGMILRASREWDIDCGKSFMIGDRAKDMEAGRRAGCRTILIETPFNRQVAADYRARDIQDAAQWIMNRDL